jgi:thioredoxin-related protein
MRRRNEMIRASILFLLLFAAGSLLAAEADSGLASGLVNPGYAEQPTWFKHSFLDLKEDVWEASAEGKRVILYFYQDGCPYCAKLLNENFSIKSIVDETTKGFQVIAINIWGDNEVIGYNGNATTEKSFAADNKVMYTPTLLFLDEKGRTVLRINGYYPPHKFTTALDYVAGRMERKLSYHDYLAKLQPAAPSGKLHREAGYLQPPLDLRPSKRAGNKPLLVLMEMKQCPPCDDLHQQILNQPSLQASLKKFDVALVDIWSSEPLVTPDGEHRKSSEWAAKLKVNYAPSMILFDPQGKEVFRTESYLRTFHTQAALEYVASGSYKDEPNFQRYVQQRAESLREQGIVVDLLK